MHRRIIFETILFVHVVSACKSWHPSLYRSSFVATDMEEVTDVVPVRRSAQHDRHASEFKQQKETDPAEESLAAQKSDEGVCSAANQEDVI
jgi:hypothetical protein